MHFIETFKIEFVVAGTGFFPIGTHKLDSQGYMKHSFLKLFLVAGGGFYFYYIHQENKLDKQRKIVRKKGKIFKYMAAFPCGCNSTFSFEQF